MFFPLIKFFYFLLHLINYATTVGLIFPFYHPPHMTPHSLRLSTQHCSCPWVMHISSLATPFPILYCTSPWLFCNYLFVLLNPLTSSPIPHNPLTSSKHQNTLHIHDSVCSSSLISLVFRFNC